MYPTFGTNRVWSFALDQKPSNIRSRFTLLMLEYGEYYFQDYSVFMYPMTTLNQGQSIAFEDLQHRRVQGRLKFCSRSLVFEPLDIGPPLLRFSFKHIENDLKTVDLHVDASGRERLRSSNSAEPFRTVEFKPVDRFNDSGDEAGTLFEFYCTQVTEMKANNKTAPYVTSKSDQVSFRQVFSLVHSALTDFLKQVNGMRELCRKAETHSISQEPQLLAPYLSQRLGQRCDFDTSQLVDFREELLLAAPAQADRITPLLKHPGAVMVTSARIYFQPAPLNHAGDAGVSYSFTLITQIFRRRHLLRHQGVEIYLRDGTSIFFNFTSKQTREKVYNILMNQPELKRIQEQTVRSMVKKWQRKEISNFEYLAYLNCLADRSINDLTQYPVFPWVIQDYTSSSLDLSDPGVYRDLSKPIGALNPERLLYFKERLENMPRRDETQPSQDIPPPFLYGTHYSAPGYVLFYLLRAAPEHMLCLQNGRFDITDRLFISMAETWESVLQNQADLKELIPEFYDPNGHGEFLLNFNDLDLGTTQAGRRAGDVELPPWAKNHRDFVQKLQEALESDIVSEHLHEWIDLVFGFKQSGEIAEQCDNLFYYLTYEGAVDLEEVDDPVEKAALEAQISEFGQTPKQVFLTPHPSRKDSHAKVEVAAYFTQPTLDSESFVESAKDEMVGIKVRGTFESLANTNHQAGLPIPPVGTRLPPTARIKIPAAGPPIIEQYAVYNQNQPVEDIDLDLIRKLWVESNQNKTTKPKSPVALALAETPQVINGSGLTTTIILTGSEPLTLHRDPVTDVCLNSTGTVLCSTSKDCSLKVTNIERSQEDAIQTSLYRSFPGELAITCCTLTQDSRYVIAGSWDNTIFMYSVDSARVVSSISDAHDDSISCLSLNGKKLATGSWDGVVKTWKLVPGGISPSPLLELFDVESSVFCMAFSEDASLIVAGSEQGLIQIWDASIGNAILAFKGSNGEEPVHDMNITDSMIFIASGDKTIKAFDQNGNICLVLQTGAEALSIAVGKSYMVGGFSDGCLRAWARSNTCIVSTVAEISGAHSGPVTALCSCCETELDVHSVSLTIASGSEDCTVRIWNLLLKN